MITVTDIAGGHRVTVTDADGAKSFDVLDGAAGSGQWGIDDYASAGVEVSVFTIDKDVDAAYYANYIDRLRAIATNYPKKLIGTFRK